MNAERWAYIKALAPPAARYIHISCNAFMETVKDEVTGVTTQVPRVVRAGGTYRKPKS